MRQPRIQRYVAPVVGDLELVVLGRFSRIEIVQAPAQVGDEVDDLHVGFDADNLALPSGQLRHLDRYLVTGDDVGEHCRNGQQLRQIAELANPGDGPQSRSGGVDFDGGDGVGERRAPVAEVGHTGGLQQIRAQIALHHPQLPQRVGDRCAGGEGRDTFDDPVLRHARGAGLIPAALAQHLQL
jgi:hypothetical protein